MAYLSLIACAKSACFDRKLLGSPHASLCTSRSGGAGICSKSNSVMADDQQLLPAKLIDDKL